jgi:hypothetical protein
MPTATSANLTLTTVDQTVTIRVRYTAGFSPFERHLANLGLIFRERIRVFGVDPPGSTTGTRLHDFPAQDLPVTNGTTTQTIQRDRQITVSRSSLQEDIGLGDNDEIRCRIRIAALGLPPAETSGTFTDQEVLVG